DTSYPAFVLQGAWLALAESREIKPLEAAHFFLAGPGTCFLKKFSEALHVTLAPRGLGQLHPGNVKIEPGRLFLLVLPQSGGLFFRALLTSPPGLCLRLQGEPPRHNGTKQ